VKKAQQKLPTFVHNQEAKSSVLARSLVLGIEEAGFERETFKKFNNNLK